MVGLQAHLKSSKIVAMTISEVARKSGLRASAIRYYEEAGLLPQPPRTGGRRRYDRRVLERLALLDFAKQCGFSLAEVRGMLNSFGDDVPLAPRLQAVAERKLAELDRQRQTIALALQCRCADLGECGRRILARKSIGTT